MEAFSERPSTLLSTDKSGFKTLRSTNMKHLLIASGLFVVAAAFNVQANAAEDLCAANLQSLQDQKVSTAESYPEVKTLVEETITNAKAAQAQGNNKKCISITRKALIKLRTYNN
jgi:hypothetical protein